MESIKLTETQIERFYLALMPKLR